MPSLGLIKILVVDHRALICHGISLILDGFSDLQVVGEAHSTQEALEHLALQYPDIVTLDIELPGHPDGIELIRRIHQEAPNTKVIVLTNLLEASTIRAALAAGVQSYLLKNSSGQELAQAVQATYQGLPVLSGEVTRLLIKEVTSPESVARSLTLREQQVLELMSRGLNNHSIASELSVSISTVQFHVSHILTKLGVHNRTEATAFAFQHHLAPSGKDSLKAYIQ